MSQLPPRSPLAGLEPPAPPPDLRDAALGAARQAFVVGSRPDVWTRLFRNPALRLAWGTAVLALAAAHAFLPLGLSTPARGSRHLAPPPAEPEVEVEGIARLPRLDERLLPSLKGA